MPDFGPTGIDPDWDDHGSGSEEHKYRMIEKRRACEARYQGRLDLLEKVGKTALAWRAADIHLAGVLGVTPEGYPKALQARDDQWRSFLIALDKFKEIQ